MRPMLCSLLAAALLLTAAPRSRATVAYADSEDFPLDTVTAVDAPGGGPAPATRLAAIAPNPFNPSTTIRYELAADGPFELAIFDLRGRLVRVLESGAGTAGRRQASWNGLDRSGQAAPSGAYCCRLVAGGTTQTMKLLLTK